MTGVQTCALPISLLCPFRSISIPSRAVRRFPMILSKDLEILSHGLPPQVSRMVLAVEGKRYASFRIRPDIPPSQIRKWKNTGLFYVTCLFVLITSHVLYKANFKLLRYKAKVSLPMKETWDELCMEKRPL